MSDRGVTTTCCKGGPPRTECLTCPNPVTLSQAKNYAWVDEDGDQGTLTFPDGRGVDAVAQFEIKDAERGTDLAVYVTRAEAIQICAWLAVQVERGR